jgi:hypothetical protein
MQTNHSSKQNGKKPVFWIFILGLAGIALFLGLSNLIRGNQASTIYPEDGERDAVRIKNLAELRAENDTKLNTYAWADRAKGKVQIPVSEAMKLVLGDLNSRKPQSAYPIDGAAPAPAVNGAAAPASEPKAAAKKSKSDNVPDVSGVLPSNAPDKDDATVLSAPVSEKTAKNSKASQ